MRRRTLGTLVLLALLSMVGVVLTQYIWLRRAQQYQNEQVELQKQQAAHLDKQFNDRVVIALTDVTERILSITKDPSNLFDAVKLVSPNYFAVTINDTIHPYLLENLLKHEFERRGISEDFEYGIYDCFTDSIVYDNYVSQKDSAVADTAQHSDLLNRNLSKMLAVATSAGISWAWAGTPEAGWTVTLSIPSIHALFDFVGNSVVSFFFQEVAYRTSIKEKA